MTDLTATKSSLGSFLRARRALLQPADLDLPDYGRRRVVGLRREELAMVAGVSPHYYARLERGDDRHPSPEVVDALAGALRLDVQAHAHLRALAARAGRPSYQRGRPEELAPGLDVLMSMWRAQPCVVLGRYRDVLAATPVATLVNPAFSVGSNLLRNLFLDPRSHDVYGDWEDVARGGVAGLRASAGADADDPVLLELVGELSAASEDFSRLWSRYDARERTVGAKLYLTQLAGPLELRFATFTVNGAEGQTLFAFYAQPGSTDEHALAHLAGLSRDPCHRAAEVGAERADVAAGRA